MADVHELLDLWIENVKDDELLAELTALKESGDENAITDAFFQDLAFGTAGLRGTIGAGTNRMNIYTVGRATQGFANYLNATFENPTVAIARDSCIPRSPRCPRFPGQPATSSAPAASA